MFEGTLVTFTTKALARIALRSWRDDAVNQSHLAGAKYKIVRFTSRTQNAVNAALRLQLAELRKAFGPFSGPQGLAFKLLKEAVGYDVERLVTYRHAWPIDRDATRNLRNQNRRLQVRHQ